MSSGPLVRRRIGILGGSFDPVHRGHLHAARAALEAYALDRVVFVPAAQAPHKPGRRLAPGSDRLAMLALAIRGEPRFATCDLELERGGTSYTIDTVRELRARVGEPADSDLFLIVGRDNVSGLPAWRDARELLELVQPVVVHRADDGEHDDVERRDVQHRDAGARSSPSAPDRSTLSDDDQALIAEVARNLGRDAALKVRAGWLRLPPVRVSSTSLRSDLPQLERDAQRAGLDPAVLEYIRAHGLYGTSA